VEWLLKLLSVTPREERSKQYNNEANLLRVYQKEMQELVKFKEDGKISAHGYDTWRLQLEEQIAYLEQETVNPEMLDSAANEMQDRQAEIHLLRSRKDMLADLVQKNLLTQSLAHTLNGAIDTELDRITSRVSAVVQPAANGDQEGRK
jgi:hypothetical protein